MAYCILTSIVLYVKLIRGWACYVLFHYHSCISFSQLVQSLHFLVGLMLCCLLTEIVLLTMHRTIHLYGHDGDHTSSNSDLALKLVSPPTSSNTSTSLISKEQLLEKASWLVCMLYCTVDPHYTLGKCPMMYKKSMYFYL